MNLSLDYISRKKTSLHLFVCCLAALVGFSVLQDVLHAGMNNYRFYLSESLLFSLNWLALIPGLFFQTYVYRMYLQKRIVALPFLCLAGFTMHLLFAPLIPLAGSSLFLDHTYSYFPGLLFLLSDKLYSLLIIYLLIALMILGKKHETAHKTVVFTEKLLVNTGTNNRIVRVSEIIQIYSESPYVAIETAEGSFLVNDTLKSMSGQLDPDLFVRIHKTRIVNLAFVRSYRSRLNGDFDLTLINDKVVRLSRNFSRSFKLKLNSSTQQSIYSS